ncbi:bifunctional 2-polyprenyl-6-hydroxyphenol methylase/3-demethylubiquinol 3-O-methyltransferase UbiG [Mucilaginibacter sp. SG564]|uniref:class I SAM-dependent methyltransferase n=1 Tax=Mucilaginibacter sp. SG564 TaxID=2587022 RepID=UPI0015579C5B|nr:class I SAM-dependent methyltransferase [Mucilaginibacter sp. SG564]NOW94984.1 2-polyprenyl-3-methyl-5-hydroxy-6-metoxy-1,4-benzoquinol methylase [Mucilaginibacter sp. SG564]
MEQPLNYIYQKIETLSPMHSKKLKKNIAFFDERYYEQANSFFARYINILHHDHKTLDYSIDCYLRMIADVNSETVEFLRTGKYTSSTFAEVNQRVYARPETMEYYMHGLIMSQFLWKHHYQMLQYFTDTLPQYIKATKSYLEVGVGHGLYLSKALEILNDNTTLTAVDISETSITLAKNFIKDSRINYNLKDIFEFNNRKKYDFITLGEVLEHVEDPLKLLQKLKTLLSDEGILFFTTPTNAPAIDHIYLFNTVGEIQDIIKAAGFEIETERSLLSEEVSPERAAKLKIAILYGAFLKKSKAS